jgi:hypothetical protein
VRTPTPVHRSQIRRFCIQEEMSLCVPKCRRSKRDSRIRTGSKLVNPRPCVTRVCVRVARFFLTQFTKMGESIPNCHLHNYQLPIKCTKLP